MHDSTFAKEKLSTEYNINICLSGHSQVGKSTILGRLLVELGFVSLEKVKEYREKARSLGEEEHVYALMMHTLKKEKEIKKTIYPARIRISFPQKQKSVTLIDTPGLNFFYKNMIFGIFQSDGAILCVEARGGIQKETVSILHILKGLGIPIVGVIITKMDIVNYSEADFNEIKEQVTQWLHELEFKIDGLPFCATSGLYGEGLVKYSNFNEKLSVSLYKMLEDINLNIQNKRQNEPLRLTVRRNDVIKVRGFGTVAIGQVESGILSEKDEIIFEPISSILDRKVIAIIRSIRLAKGVIATPDVSLENAVPRNIIGMAISSAKLDIYELLRKHNNIAGLIESRPTVAKEFLAEITIIDHLNGIVVGYEPTINPHIDQIPGKIVEILAKKNYGEDWQKEKLDFIKQGQQAIVRIKTQKEISIEEEEKIPWLSKFIIREDKIIGFGRCTRIEKR